MGLLSLLCWMVVSMILCVVRLILVMFILSLLYVWLMVCCRLMGLLCWSCLWMLSMLVMLFCIWLICCLMLIFCFLLLWLWRCCLWGVDSGGVWFDGWWGDGDVDVGLCYCVFYWVGVIWLIWEWLLLICSGSLWLFVIGYFNFLYWFMYYFDWGVYGLLLLVLIYIWLSWFIVLMVV